MARIPSPFLIRKASIVFTVPINKNSIHLFNIQRTVDSNENLYKKRDDSIEDIHSMITIIIRDNNKPSRPPKNQIRISGNLLCLII